MTHPYEEMNSEISDLAREIVSSQGYTWDDALLDARLWINELLEYAAQWDSAAAAERALEETERQLVEPKRLTRENAFPAWACRARPDDLFKDEA